MEEKTGTAGEREVPPKRAPKSFLQTVQDHQYGFTADELTAALQECIDTSERTGKVTELTFKLKIKPESKAAGRYSVLADVSTKMPPKEREAAIMFVGPDGHLTNQDPRQQSLPGIRLASESGPGVRVADDAAQQPAVRVG